MRRDSISSFAKYNFLALRVRDLAEVVNKISLSTRQRGNVGTMYRLTYVDI